MNKLLPKICYGLVLFVFVLTLTSHSTLAAELDFSKGVMPDNPLYQIDLNFEKLNLLTAGSDNQKLAKLHLQYGTERLNELDYLAEKNDLSISNLDNIVSVSEDYQVNINKFSKLISQNTNNSAEQKVNEISPKINELQAIQTKVVSKINENPVQDEVKIIVKSTIQESQVDLMQAVVNVKKPIEEKAVSGQNDSTDTTLQSTNPETVRKLDETIENLNKQKNLLAAEIKEDEKNLKVKKEITDNQPIVNVDGTPVNSDDPSAITDTSDLGVEPNTEDSNVIDGPTSTDDPQSGQTTENVNSDNPKIEDVIDTTTNSLDENPLIASIEWYYSPTCDFVSDKPGKDPVCGEEMIPISALPKDHTFFSKYIYKEGKYVQNVNDITQKKEDDILKQAEKPVIPTTPTIVPTDTTTNITTPTPTTDQPATPVTNTTL